MMIPIKRHLPRSSRQLWNRSPKPPRYFGEVEYEEYSKPFKWAAWVGRMPRTMEFVVFMARRIKSGRIRTNVLTHELAKQVYKAKLAALQESEAQDE